MQLAVYFWPGYHENMRWGWDERGWDGWMASQAPWTRVWASSGSWWWTGEPGMLQSMGSQRVRHDWATELNWPWEIQREGPWSGLPIPVESLEPSRTPWPKAVLRAFWDEPVNMENFLYRKFHQLLQWFYHSTVFEEKIFKCERKEPSKWKQLWKGYSNFIWRVCYHLTHAHGLFESDRNCHINLCNTNFVNNN